MISDFGLSHMDDGTAMATACGTPGYVGKKPHIVYMQELGVRINVLRRALMFSSGSSRTRALWKGGGLLVNWRYFLHLVC